MVPGDVTFFVDAAGIRHPAIVASVNEDGTVELAVLNINKGRIPVSASPLPGHAWDPTLPNDAQGAYTAYKYRPEATSPAGLWPPRPPGLTPNPGNQEKFFTGLPMRAPTADDIARTIPGSVLPGGDIVRPTADGGLERADEPAQNADGLGAGNEGDSQGCNVAGCAFSGAPHYHGTSDPGAVNAGENTGANPQTEQSATQEAPGPDHADPASNG